jgi:hypothetical protein
MFKSLIHRATPLLITLFTLALTVGTAFAQDSEGGSAPSGLATLVLLMGLGAIGAIFVVNWSQSAPEDEE